MNSRPWLTVNSDVLGVEPTVDRLEDREVTEQRASAGEDQDVGKREVGAAPLLVQQDGGLGATANGWTQESRESS